MAKPFEETKINGMTLRNRLVRSATWEGMCDSEGAPTEALNRCYRDLAEGEVGLIVSGNAFVRPEGRQYPGTMGMHSDHLESGMRELTRVVHEAGGKLCVQLVHAGGQTTAATAGRQPLAPSALRAEQFEDDPKAMSEEDIREVIAAFGRAAGRAKAWGFDAVELHGAHGYLISQFLSPYTNRRSGAYGGPLENRSRFLMETYRAVRGAVGDSFPVLIKLNGSDFLPGGFSLEDGIEVARWLDAAGIDAIEVSGGTPASGEQAPVRKKIKHREQEGYNLGVARPIKQAVRCPVMVVGGFRSYDLIEEVIGSGVVDYVSLARPLIREPHLVQRWRGGDTSRATCISCNKCFRPGLKGEGIYCVVEKEEREKKR